MGIFGTPKCPRCGNKTVRTYASFPYPPYRCNNCVRNNAEKKALEKRISDLEKQLKNK